MKTFLHLADPTRLFYEPISFVQIVLRDDIYTVTVLIVLAEDFARIFGHHLCWGIIAALPLVTVDVLWAKR